MTPPTRRIPTHAATQATDYGATTSSGGLVAEDDNDAGGAYDHNCDNNDNHDGDTHDEINHADNQAMKMKMITLGRVYYISGHM